MPCSQVPVGTRNVRVAFDAFSRTDWKGMGISEATMKIARDHLNSVVESGPNGVFTGARPYRLIQIVSVKPDDKKTIGWFGPGSPASKFLSLSNLRKLNILVVEPKGGEEDFRGALDVTKGFDIDVSQVGMNLHYSISPKSARFVLPPDVAKKLDPKNDPIQPSFTPCAFGNSQFPMSIENGVKNQLLRHNKYACRFGSDILNAD